MVDKKGLLILAAFAVVITVILQAMGIDPERIKDLLQVKQ